MRGDDWGLVAAVVIDARPPCATISIISDRFTDGTSANIDWWFKVVRKDGWCPAEDVRFVEAALESLDTGVVGDGHAITSIRSRHSVGGSRALLSSYLTRTNCGVYGPTTAEYARCFVDPDRDT